MGLQLRLLTIVATIFPAHAEDSLVLLQNGASLMTRSRLAMFTRDPDKLKQVVVERPEDLEALADELAREVGEEAANHALREAQKAPLCIDGKLVPELYVLGTQKAATTSLAYDLVRAGVKELQLLEAVALDNSTFASNTSLISTSEEANETMQARWLRNLPQCPTTTSSSRKTVLADMTPRNLRLVPLPSDVRRSDHDFVPAAYSAAGADAARMLSELHGPTAQNLTLVVLLRDPLERLLSTWYDKDCTYCRASNMTFEKALTLTLAEARQTPPAYQDWLWGSMYAPQLRHYLQFFEPRQLMVVPFQQYVKFGKQVLFKKLAAQLHAEHLDDATLSLLGDQKEGRSTSGKVASHLNGNEDRPKADDVVSESLQKDFQAFLEPSVGDLADLLAETGRKGAWLANYTGSVGSASDVRQWLTSTW